MKTKLCKDREAYLKFICESANNCHKKKCTQKDRSRAYIRKSLPELAFFGCNFWPSIKSNTIHEKKHNQNSNKRECIKKKADCKPSSTNKNSSNCWTNNPCH